MAQNTSPVYPLTVNAGSYNALLSTAMTNTKAYDGTEAAGTAMVLAYTAGSFGSKVDSITVSLTSTNGATASGTTAATVVRFWLNNGTGANTTATNNKLLGELAIPATTVVALATAVNTTYSFAYNKAIPLGSKIYAGITVAVGGTACALQVSVDGGDLS